MPSNETLYTNKVFQAAALPLLKVIATDVPSLNKQFKGVDAIYQVSAKTDDGLAAVHFHVENGEWTKVIWSPTAATRRSTPNSRSPRWRR